MVSKKIIKEVIVVEGRDDIDAVKKAVDAEIIAVGGFGINAKVIERIKEAQKRKGVIVLENVYSEDKIMEDVLDLDILDIVIDEDITIYTEADKFLEVKDNLDNLGYDKYLVSEVTFVPDNYISLDEVGTEKVMSLIEALEDIDDVQNVYHNLEL